MSALNMTSTGSTFSVTLDRQQHRVLKTLMNYVDLEKLREDLADEVQSMTNTADIAKTIHDHEVMQDVRKTILRS